MKTTSFSAFSLQPLAFAILPAFALVVTAPSAPAQTSWGSALSFDGVDDYVQSQQPVDLANRSFSIEAWAQRRSSETMDLIVGQGYGAPNQCIIFGFHYYGGNQFLFDFYGNGIGSGTADTDTAWHHWAGTYDASTKRHCLYRDGVLLACHTNTLEHYQGSGPLWIGVGYFGEAPNEFDGQVDEVRIWGVARSQAEIQDTMLRPLSGSEANLLAYWNFNEGAGTSASDSSTNGFNATLFNGPTWATSTLPQAPVGWGNALSFDGADDCVVFTRPVSNDFTLECWFRTTQTFGSGSGHWWEGAGLVDGEEYGAMRDFGLSLGAGKVLFGTGMSVDVTIRSPSAVNDGQWHHVAATRQKSNGAMQLFVDGSLVASGANASGVSLDLPTQLRLGSLASGNNFFSGQIDEVRIWNQVRSADQIREGRCHPLTGSEPGLTAYFRLDEETGPTAFDATANHFDGTLVGGPVQQRSSIPPFVNINVGLPSAEDAAAAWGDYDEDGDLDLVLTDWTWEGVSGLYRNEGNGTFNYLDVGLELGVYDSSVAWRDFDNDGDLDLFIMARGEVPSQMSRIYWNDGEGRFAFTDLGLPVIHYGADKGVAWGDFDNDGRLDVVLAGSTGSGAIAQLWRNTGSGFVNANAGLPAVFSAAVAAGDYDNDGWLDVLLSGVTGAYPNYNRITQLWRNNTHGTFTRNDISLPGLDGPSIAWGDYDNDGRLDILLSGTTGAYPNVNRITQLWHNNGDGTFSEVHNTGLPGLEDGSIAWGDYDNDGRLDVLLAGWAGTSTSATQITQVWRNNGDGTFAAVDAGLPGVSSAIWGDYDDDKRLDILLTGDPGSGWIVQLWRNIGLTANTPPTAPTGLTATVIGNSVTLGWNPATDGQTPTAGLTYNLRVGTSPGGVDLVSPHSAPTTGLRQLPSMGNAQHGLTASFNLPSGWGVYYWSVQAVDTAFAGSTFAAEAHFVVHPPLVATLPTADVAPTSATLCSTVNPMENETLGWFEYGLTAKYGEVTPVTSVGSGPEALPVNVPVSGLLPWMTYHYRVLASNRFGVSVGSDMTVTLPGPSTGTLSLSPLPDRTLPQGGNTSVAFTAQPAGVNVQVRCDNPVLLPPSGLIVGGLAPNYTLGLAPDPLQSGSAQVTVIASDGTRAVTQTFTLTVTPLDSDPSQLLQLTDVQSVPSVPPEFWQFRIVDFGTASTNYAVEYRSDLSPTNSWVAATNVTDLYGGLYRVDTGPPQRKAGFYRVRGIRWLNAGFNLPAATMDEGAVSGPVIVFNGLYNGSVNYSWSGTEGTNTGILEIHGSTAVIPLPVTDNTELNQLRYLTLRLEGGPGFALGGTTASTITVEENDAEWQGVLQSGQSSLGFVLKIQQSGGNFQGEIKSRGFGLFPTNALVQLTFSGNKFCAVATNVPLPALVGSAVFNLPHHVDLRLDAANGTAGQRVSATEVQGLATLVSVVPGRPDLDTVITSTFLLAKPPAAASTYEAPLTPTAP